MTFVFQGLKNPSTKRTLSRFISGAIHKLPLQKVKGEINFIFVSDRQIQKINRKFLNHDYPTDVIAFPYACRGGPPCPPSSEPFPFGDIYISLDTAKREAKKGDYSIQNELALYALHGLLHLLDYDDHGVKNRKRMFAAQKRIFQKINPRLAPPDHQ